MSGTSFTSDERVNCDYEFLGCTHQSAKNDMIEHLKGNIEAHVEVLTKFLCDLSDTKHTDTKDMEEETALPFIVSALIETGGKVKRRRRRINDLDIVTPVLDEAQMLNRKHARYNTRRSTLNQHITQSEKSEPLGRNRPVIETGESNLTKFENFYLSSGLSLSKDINNGITLTLSNKDTIKSNTHQFAILDHTLNSASLISNSSFKWSLQVRFHNVNSERNWFAFGVCLKQRMENPGLYIEETPCGLFTVSSAGVVCHNNSSFKNNSVISHFPAVNSYCSVMLEYDYMTKELSVSIGESSWKVSKVFSTERQMQLMPCVVLKNSLDEVDFQSNS